MAEIQRPDHYLPFRTPEWRLPHAGILARAHFAADSLWLPTDDENHFTYDKSAAGKNLIAHFSPPIIRGSSPELSISILEPNVRCAEGTDRAFGLIADLGLAHFRMHSPEDAAWLANRGVSCELQDTSGRVIYLDSITYWQFNHFANVSGVFEQKPPTPAQRLGRGIMRVMEDYAQSLGVVDFPQYPGRFP